METTSPIQRRIEELQGFSREDYVKALEGNDWRTLQELWQQVDLYDPGQVYGADYSPRRQAVFFGKGAEAYGGSFVQKLKALYGRADPQNSLKIRRTWPEIWIQYVGMGIHVARQDK